MNKNEVIIKLKCPKGKLFFFIKVKYFKKLIFFYLFKILLIL